MANEMTICKQCVHYLVCMHYSPERKKCPQFKDSTNFVEVVHAHWIEHEWAEEENGLLVSNYECSACHSWERDEGYYCPNCGADMRERKDNE